MALMARTSSQVLRSRSLARPVGAGQQNPGVVVEHVEAAEGVDGRPHHRRHLRLVAHVGGHTDRGRATVAQLPDESLHASGIQVGDRQRGPLGSKTAADGSTLPAYRTGHQASPTLQPSATHSRPP